ncbi:DUF6338 family protein [Streptomyces sp. TRM64462]|uniref:DUF6338 family protein n=1 Tax=Streptomyces sp. TRM64462 TaxID=2741726 RepID=UPI001586BEEC|nr:DUF6338 family protein [Streptomyces sp. TRM64462]
MPTTPIGLLLLVVLLLPGLTYVVVRERMSSERRMSPFRETGTVVFCSVLTELVVLGVFAGVRACWPGMTPDVGRLIREGTTYTERHYASLTLWTVGMLLTASTLAGLAAWRYGKEPHPSATSAWWQMFKQWKYPIAVEINVACLLDDGSLVEGCPGAFNTSAEDSPDRDIILVEPIRYRPPGATGEAQPYPAGAVCISARRIVAMFVTHSPATGERAGPAGTAGDPASSVAAS